MICGCNYVYSDEEGYKHDHYYAMNYNLHSQYQVHNLGRFHADGWEYEIHNWIKKFFLNFKKTYLISTYPSHSQPSEEEKT